MMLMLRPLAEMMPAVTVEVRLKGLPTAKTHSPSLTSSLLPNGKAGSFLASIFNTAKSVVGSVPITSAVNSRPSFNETLTSLALSTTWLLVTM